MRIYAYLAIIAAVLASYAGVYLYGRSAGADSVRIEWDEANEAQRKIEAATAAEAASRLEVVREKERIVYQKVIQTVDRIVDRPVYRTTQCLDDDGLRVVRCALRGESPDTCVPDKPLRPASGLPGRVSGYGLKVDYGDNSGLPGLREKTGGAGEGG